MKRLLEVISYCALILVIAAPILFYAGWIDLDQSKLWMLVATIAWFTSASCWIGTKGKEKANAS